MRMKGATTLSTECAQIEFGFHGLRRLYRQTKIGRQRVELDEIRIVPVTTRASILR
jgi:hypothetical protein